MFPLSLLNSHTASLSVATDASSILSSCEIGRRARGNVELVAVRDPQRSALLGSDRLDAERRVRVRRMDTEHVLFGHDRAADGRCSGEMDGADRSREDWTTRVRRGRRGRPRSSHRWRCSWQHLFKHS